MAEYLKPLMSACVFECVIALRNARWVIVTFTGGRGASLLPLPARPPAGPLPVPPGHVLSCQTINNLQISFLLQRAINCVFRRVLGRRVNWKYRANLAKRKNVWKSVDIGGLGKRFYRVVKAFNFSEKADRICFLPSKECPYSISNFHTSWFINKNFTIYI